MCSGSEAGSHLRRMDFVYHSPLGLRVIKKKKESNRRLICVQRSGFRVVIVRTSSGPKALEPSCSRAKRVSEVDSRCMLLIVPLFHGSSRFESLILSHHSRFECECNTEEINDDDDVQGLEFRVWGSGLEFRVWGLEFEV